MKNPPAPFFKGGLNFEAIGEDPSREGLRQTQQRFEKAFESLTQGYRKTLSDVVGDGLFESPSDGLVLQKDIEFYSLCEHHLLPFFGKAHVAYLPGEKIIGLSKVARVVDLYAQRLQVQERLTEQIASAIDSLLKPRALVVIVEASHFCMMMRGVSKQQSLTVTQQQLGDLEKNPRFVQEVWQMIRPR